MMQLGELGEIKVIHYSVKTRKAKIPTKLIWTECPNCKKRRWQRLQDYQKQQGRGCCVGMCKACSDVTRRGKPIKQPAWKGGRWIRDGYVNVKIEPDDPMIGMAKKATTGFTYYIPEHRLVRARHIGRPLSSEEHVHHINGIRDDNRIENLAILDNKTHPKMSFVHALQKRIRELEKNIQETLAML